MDGTSDISLSESSSEGVGVSGRMGESIATTGELKVRMSSSVDESFERRDRVWNDLSFVLWVLPTTELIDRQRSSCGVTERNRCVGEAPRIVGDREPRVDFEHCRNEHLEDAHERTEGDTSRGAGRERGRTRRVGRWARLQAYRKNSQETQLAMTALQKRRRRRAQSASWPA